LVFSPPLYFFRIRNGRFSGAADCGTELSNRDAAWEELTNVCGDLIGSISRIALNQRGIMSDFGRPWTRASIHQILTNEKYIGNKDERLVPID
jgi:Recombinase